MSKLKPPQILKTRPSTPRVLAIESYHNSAMIEITKDMSRSSPTISSTQILSSNVKWISFCTILPRYLQTSQQTYPSIPYTLIRDISNLSIQPPPLSCLYICQPLSKSVNVHLTRHLLYSSNLVYQSDSPV